MEYQKYTRPGDGYSRISLISPLKGEVAGVSRRFGIYFFAVSTCVWCCYQNIVHRSMLGRLRDPGRTIWNCHSRSVMFYCKKLQLYMVQLNTFNSVLILKVYQPLTFFPFMFNHVLFKKLQLYMVQSNTFNCKSIPASHLFSTFVPERSYPVYEGFNNPHERPSSYSAHTYSLSASHQTLCWAQGMQN